MAIIPRHSRASPLWEVQVTPPKMLCFPPAEQPFELSRAGAKGKTLQAMIRGLLTIFALPSAEPPRPRRILEYPLVLRSRF